MEIALLKDITTEGFLVEIEAEGKKYDGLYVDMDNAPERKYVKDKADGILQLLKKIERKRIDALKEYKNRVEKDALDITERLKIEN